ncbi:flagellar hook assembly protein FlgD [Aureimonas flava]|uniref:Basal-body rod modification protein FlgD n=1 Tax=Aureimonas flava TaxID=2320271 RepID=A0A3A1WLZ6_9HYPH|nr:flagellar hook assembly protein FlgD [Aureimonas flava]RIY01881.1 flagellar hook assembly protein FlgD [Aureimonas flava]
MTTVSSVSSTAATTTSSTSSEVKTGLDYDAFLKLLVAQMKNQDPLNPTDPTEQMSQLASFSNVEQSIKLNQKLEAMTTLSTLTQANNLIGRTVTTGDGSVTGVVKSIQVASDGAIATLEDGKLVLLEAGIKVE